MPGKVGRIGTDEIQTTGTKRGLSECRRGDVRRVTSPGNVDVFVIAAVTDDNVCGTTGGSGVLVNRFGSFVSVYVSVEDNVHTVLEKQRLIFTTKQFTFFPVAGIGAIHGYVELHDQPRGLHTIENRGEIPGKPLILQGLFVQHQTGQGGSTVRAEGDDRHWPKSYGVHVAT